MSVAAAAASTVVGGHVIIMTDTIELHLSLRVGQCFNT